MLTNNDFNHIIYWTLNDDLQTSYNINDKIELYNHWKNFGYKENRLINIPDEIFYDFDIRVYYSLYDDIKIIYTKYDYVKILCHYYKFGISEKRIYSFNDIILPSDFYDNNIYINCRDLSKFHNIYKMSEECKYKIMYAILFNKKVITNHNDTNKNNTYYIQHYDINKLLSVNTTYQYICCHENINNNFDKYINGNKIYGNFIYNPDNDLLEFVDNNFIIDKTIISLLNANKHIIINNIATANNILKILRYLNVNYDVNVLFIIESEYNEFKFMYESWIKYLKNNVKILILLKNDTVNHDEDSYDNVQFYKLTELTCNEMDIMNIIYYIIINKINIDWIIYSRNKIFINIDNINNTIYRWYNYNIIRQNGKIYCFKHKLFKNMNDIINNNYDDILLHDNTKNNNILNCCDYSTCYDDELNKYLVVFL